MMPYHSSDLEQCHVRLQFDRQQGPRAPIGRPEESHTEPVVKQLIRYDTGKETSDTSDEDH